MGVTKTDNFSDQQNEIAQVAKVLGHPARIAILQHIMQQKSCICGDLVLEIGLAQATISQHLRELKNAELIQGTIDGTSVCYCINTNKWNKSKDLLIAFLNQNETLNTLCC